MNLGESLLYSPLVSKWSSHKVRITHLLPKALLAAAVATPGLFAIPSGVVQAASPGSGSQVAFRDIHGNDYQLRAAQPAAPAAQSAQGTLTTLSSVAADGLSAAPAPIADNSSLTLGDCLSGDCDTQYTGCHSCGAVGACGCYSAKGLIAGVEATFLWADVEGGGAGSFTVFDAANNPVTGMTNGGSDISGEYGFAPRLWLGYQWDKWGLVGRYWDYRTDGRDFEPFLGPPAPLGFESLTNLRLYTTDLELRRLYCHRGWEGYASFGVRYAHLEVASGLRNTTLLGNELLSASALSGQAAHGTGLTGSLVGARPISKHSSAQLFWSARGSVLWGHSDNEVYTTASAISTLPASAAAFNGASGGGDNTLWIGEVQLGVQWTHQLRCLPGVAFLRVVGEYQYWDTDSDGGAMAFSVADINPGSAILATATAGDTRVDLYGFGISTGFSW